MRSFDAAALRDRISKATPPPRLRLAPPPVEVLDSADPRWWRYLEDSKWKNDEVRRGLNKVEFAGDVSGLDCRHLPPLAVLRDQGFKALVVDELAAKEQFEIEVIREFLPQPLSEEEITSLINDAVSSTGAASMQDMGKLMNLLKPQMAGRADMGKVSGLIKQRLS